MQAKKSLGQNFLRSASVADAIVATAGVDGHDIVVEAGPGKGVLTERLLPSAREVIAVEKDDRLMVHLALKFKSAIAAGKLTLIHGDILDFDPTERDLRAGGYKIVANIPYYITGQFLRHFLGAAAPPSRMVLMVQKEVAERIVAKDGKESILSLSVKAYGTPRYIETVRRENFSPAPNVDSAVLAIEQISRSFFDTTDESAFFTLVKKGFSSKRKMLAGNLAAANIAAKPALAQMFSACGIAATARAEELSLDQWKRLADILTTQKG